MVRSEVKSVTFTEFKNLKIFFFSFSFFSLKGIGFHWTQPIIPPGNSFKWLKKNAVRKIRSPDSSDGKVQY